MEGRISIAMAWSCCDLRGVGSSGALGALWIHNWILRDEDSPHHALGVNQSQEKEPGIESRKALVGEDCKGYQVHKRLLSIRPQILPPNKITNGHKTH